jgi:hypothetical protein
MTGKFDDLKNRFVSMYKDGVTYSMISSELGISEQTIYEWRDRLNLPLRRENQEVSWMDERTLDGLSPRQVLLKIHDGLFHPANIEPMLRRYEKLGEGRGATARTRRNLILATAYEWLRWDGSGAQPRSPKQFVAICDKAWFLIRRSELLMASRRLKEANLFPRERLSPSKLFERKWRVLSATYDLPDEIRDYARMLISTVDFAGKTPEVAVASAVWVSAKVRGRWVGQEALAAVLGVTEVSIRNTTRYVYTFFEERGQTLTPEGIREVVKLG